MLGFLAKSLIVEDHTIKLSNHDLSIVLYSGGV